MRFHTMAESGPAVPLTLTQSYPLTGQKKHRLYWQPECSSFLYVERSKAMNYSWEQMHG